NAKRGRGDSGTRYGEKRRRGDTQRPRRGHRLIVRLGRRISRRVSDSSFSASSNLRVPVSPRPTSPLRRVPHSLLRFSFPRAQRKSHYVITSFCPQPHMTSCAYHQELLASFFHHVGHRHSLTARGQLRLPQLRASLNIECPQVVVHRRRDKHQPTRGHDRSA